MCPDSWTRAMYCSLSHFITVFDFRQPGRQRGTGTCIKFYYFYFYAQRLLHFNYVRASYCCWVLGTKWQRLIPASKDLFYVFKKACTFRTESGLADVLSLVGSFTWLLAGLVQLGVCLVCVHCGAVLAREQDLSVCCQSPGHESP